MARKLGMPIFNFHYRNVSKLNKLYQVGHDELGMVK
jgi:hypothetical protein